MVKLSQQTLLKERRTRTQRVIVKQEERKEIENFQSLQQQARQLQSTEFSQITDLNEYERKYNALNPRLKPFFASPDKLRQERTERIETTKDQVDAKIIEAKEKQKINYDKYQESIEWSKGKDWSDNDDKDKYDRRKEHAYESKDAYWRAYIEGLQKGKSELLKNKDIEYSSIVSYASGLGDFQEQREGAYQSRSNVRYDQQQQIAKLEETGFKPILIQEYKEGKLQKTSTSFYNPKLKQYAKLSIPLASNIKNVSGLKKSQLGRTEINQTLKIGSRSYSFKTHEQLYVTDAGKLTTQRGGTSALTEKAILKSAQDKAFAEWKAKDKTKPYYSDVKALDISKHGYVTRGTKGIDKRSLSFIPILPDVEKKNSKIIKKIRDIIPDFYIEPFKINKFGGIGGGTLSLIPTSERSINLKEFEEKRVADISKASFGLDIEKLEKIGKKAEIDLSIQKEYQTRFERKHIKDIIYERKDFETASKEFGESQEAKIISKKYGTKIDKEIRKASSMKDLYSFSGIKSLGYQAERTAWSIIPTTPEGLVFESALIYSGLKLLKAIPPSVSNTATAGIGSYGVYKMVKPTSTLSERAGGVITAGVSFSLLGYQGLKYLKRPTVKTVKIPPPKRTLKSQSTFGRDVKIINDQKQLNKVIYSQNQKLSQTGIAGRRTVVSTKFRDIVKLDPIYKGVPYTQRGTTYSFQSLRGSYSLTTKGGYKKAYDLLIKRGGYTPYQASQTLKYYQPKVIEQFLSKGVIDIKGGKAIGSFEHLTKQPVISIDKTLGIKTRGARTIKDIYNVERKLVTLKSGKNIALQTELRSSFFLKRGSSPLDFKDFQISRGVLFGKGSELKKGYDVLKTKIKGNYMFEDATYKDIAGISIKRNVFPSDNVVRIDTSQANLINKLIDLRTKGFISKSSGIKKTPLSKTFGSSDVKVQSVKNIIKGSTGSQTTKQIPSPVTKQISQELLKQPIAIKEIQASNVKNIIKTSSKLNIGIASMQSLNIASAIKLASPQKLNLVLRGALRSDLNKVLNIKQILSFSSAQKLAQTQSLKQQLKASLKMQSLNIPSISSPAFKVPVFKVPTIPIIPIPFYFPSSSKKKGKKQLKRLIQDYAYLPDFTARALGLKAEILTKKQAKKKLKQILTGLEIRRPVKIKK